LHFLDLSINRLTTLPKSIMKLESLQELNLWGNELTILPESIGNLKSLQVLDLRMNRLTTLPESIIKLESLQELNLWGNNLSTLPGLIGNLKSPQKLDLSIFNGDFDRNMERLKQLIKNPQLIDLDSFYDFPPGFESFVSYAVYDGGFFRKKECILQDLKDLMDPDSFLENIPESTTHLTLNLIHSKMIPDSIRRLKDLTYLALIIYELDDFPSVFRGLNALKFLLIRSEIGTRLPHELLELQSLETFCLGGALRIHQFADFTPDEQSRRITNELIDSGVIFMDYDE
ncbi:hypothetical protein LCGC14_2460700, partial [marine sediment metagenome]